MERRSFLGLVAGAALAPVVADAGPLAPVLWGDGVHEDGPAIAALIRGDAVRFANAELANGTGWVGDTLWLPAGTFRVYQPVDFVLPAHRKIIWRYPTWVIMTGQELGTREIVQLALRRGGAVL
jgi:hypothetical protein